MMLSLAPVLIFLHAAFGSPTSQTLSSFGALARRESRGATNSPFDVVIIGGGPAGLSALSSLGRVRRNVLLLDSGEYRNAQASHMHDLIGFDGVTPAFFRASARSGLSQYPGVSLSNGTVHDIEALHSITHTLFALNYTTPSYSSIATIHARKIILATGLRDVLPPLPGIAKHYGNGVFTCPYCHGFEHADQKLGIIANIDRTPGLVAKMLTLNRDIVVFVNGTNTHEARKALDEQRPGWDKFLTTHAVRIDNRTMVRVEKVVGTARRSEKGVRHPSLPAVPEQNRFVIHFDEGEPVMRAALLTHGVTRPRSTIGVKLGIKSGTNGRIETVDGEQRHNGVTTHARGLYVAEDINKNSSPNVAGAIKSGKDAGMKVHSSLYDEDLSFFAHAGCEGALHGYKGSIKHSIFLAKL